MGSTGRGSDQFPLRLPDGMRDELKTAALANGRSMNAEIISRLLGTEADLRDKFAMAALTGWLASFGPGEVCKAADVSEFVYEVADSMLSTRAAVSEQKP